MPGDHIARELSIAIELADGALDGMTGGAKPAPPKPAIKAGAHINFDGVDGESTESKHKGE